MKICDVEMTRACHHSTSADGGLSSHGLNEKRTKGEVGLAYTPAIRNEKKRRVNRDLKPVQRGPNGMHTNLFPLRFCAAMAYRGNVVDRNLRIVRLFVVARAVVGRRQVRVAQVPGAYREEDRG